MRCHHASPGTDRDERAVSALLPGTEPIELSRAPTRARLAPVVDVPRRERFLAREPRARVERAVRSNRVRVRHVDVARTVVHAVGRRESVRLRLVAQERHLVVERSCRSRRSTPPPAPADVMQVPFERLERRAVASDRDQRQDASWRARSVIDAAPTPSLRTIGLKLTLTSLSANSCSLRNSSSAG